jgi:hypothetical protein
MRRLTFVSFEYSSLRVYPEYWCIKEFGFRYWIAWILVRLAYKVKNTDYYQVVKISDETHVFIRADTWGSGVQSSVGVAWQDDDPIQRYPRMKEFDDSDQALDWAYGKELD